MRFNNLALSVLAVTMCGHLRGLVHEDETSSGPNRLFRPRACLVCDELLRFGDDNYVTTKFLEQKCSKLLSVESAESRLQQLPIAADGKAKARASDTTPKQASASTVTPESHPNKTDEIIVEDVLPGDEEDGIEYVPIHQPSNVDTTENHVAGECSKHEHMPETTNDTVKIHKDLVSYYRYDGKGSSPTIKKLMLSPRAVYIANTDPSLVQKTCPGFACCGRCKTALSDEKGKAKCPPISIAAGYFLGSAPEELQNLNDVELVLISLNRMSRHVFMNYGGTHECMRGWCRMYENDVEACATAFRGLDQFMDNDPTIYCVLSGPFTKEQVNLTREACQVNKDRVLKAFNWLQKNNVLYKHIPLPTLDEIPEPYIHELFDLVESTDTNIETKRDFQFVFPDINRMSETNGGFDTPHEFTKSVLQDVRLADQVKMIARSTSTAVCEYAGNELPKAFPLQFPYGYGAKQSNCTQSKYLQYLINIAEPNKHRGSFLLLLHSLYEKERAVSRSSLKCKANLGGVSVPEAFSGVELKEVEEMLEALEKGDLDSQNQSAAMTHLLSTIHAVSGHLPFTDEAAKKERNKMFAMIAMHGLPAVFFTVTPEDLENFRIRVYASLSGVSEPPSPNATPEELERDFDLCVDMRRKYPGLCAFDFEQVLDIIIEDVLGWDVDKRKSQTEGGAFGRLNGWYIAVEEQGRKTLHAHMLLWVEGWTELLQRLYSNDETEQKIAGDQLRNNIDQIMSTKLNGGVRLSQQRRAPKKYSAHFTHLCVASKNKRKRINDDIIRDTEKDGQPLLKRVKRTVCPDDVEFFDDQHLRNLRYQYGPEHNRREKGLKTGTEIAKCKDCGHHFTSPEMCKSVLTEKYGLSEDDEEREQQIRSLMFKYSANLDDDEYQDGLAKEKREYITNFKRNLHDECHRTTCFKKGAEARCRQPDNSAEKSKVSVDPDKDLKWPKWDGTPQTRHPFYTKAQRSREDPFVNSYHPATSFCLPCNTNVQCGIDGGAPMYCTCYASKSNRKDESKSMLHALRALVNKIKAEEEKAKEDPEQQDLPYVSGFRRLLIALLSGTDDYVVSAPMARYLISNGSRFRCSHEFEYVPFKSLQSGYCNTMSVKSNGIYAYFTSRQADYIYRPTELENVCAYSFFSYFYPSKFPRKRDHDNMMDDIYSFLEGHPASGSSCLKKQIFPKIPVVTYLDFGEAASFGGSIFDPATVTDHNRADIEDYCKKILVLFLPFRELEDLTLNGSYLEKLKIAMDEKQITDEHQTILKNIQDCRNSLNAGRMKDDLEHLTKPLEPPPSWKKPKGSPEQNEEMQKRIAELLLELTESAPQGTNGSSRTSDSVTDDIATSDGIIDLCKDNCAKQNMLPPNLENASVDVAREAHPSDPPPPDPSRYVPSKEPHPKITRKDLVKHYVQTTDRHANEEDLNVNDLSADGTPENIITWSNVLFKDKDGIPDEDQQQAFRTIVASFILTYHEEATNDLPTELGTQRATTRRDYDALKSDLLKLRGMAPAKNSDKLDMFLTGAGGTGKTHVIKCVNTYGKEFCKLMGYPFDKRTIVVTALTGVAATCILGETIDSAAHLMKDLTKLKIEFIQEWKNARLLIIDEVSFATREKLEKLDRALKFLKSNLGANYGGINVVFSGDFAQLPPPGKGTRMLYLEKDFSQWNDWVNCYVELRTNHRFKDDKAFGEIMGRWHSFKETKEDIKTINTRVIGSPGGPKASDIPEDAAHCVGINQDRSAINAAIFLQHLKATHSTDPDIIPPNHTIVIKASNITTTKTKTDVTGKARTVFFSKCSDSKVKAGRRFVDPLLKLYHLRPLMLTKNDDVPKGLANGTLGLFERVVLKPGAASKILIEKIDGHYVRTIDAEYVDHIICSFDTEKGGEFPVKVEHFNATVMYPFELLAGQPPVEMPMQLSFDALPVLPNNATTGHKLQGKTKESIVINDWASFTNWKYVALSRVTTLKGLFLRKPLIWRRRPPPGALLAMIRAFEKRKPTPFHYDSD